MGVETPESSTGSERRRRIERIAVYVPATVLIVYLVIGPLWIVMNGMVSLATGATPNVPEGPGVTTRDRWAGAYPYALPVWVYIVAILPLPAVLVIGWKAKGPVSLGTSPVAIAVIALLCSVFAFDIGSYFPGPDGSYGLHWIAGTVGVATLVAAIIRQNRPRPVAPTRRRRRPAAA